jgi:hypothetical protein
MKFWESKRQNSRDSEDKAVLVAKDGKGDYEAASMMIADTEGTEAVSYKKLMKAALAIAPLWFLSNCLYNYSLMMTSVSSSTIIR